MKPPKVSINHISPWWVQGNLANVHNGLSSKKREAVKIEFQKPGRSHEEKG
jgi:hypothetical protein